MSVDFYQLKLKINYNNAGNPYLQYGPQGGVQPPEEFQAGWTEVYDMPITNTIQQNAANAFNLLAARASLLALNYYIFQAELHQASVFKSSLVLPGSAKYGGWDNEANITAGLPLTAAYASQLCSNPQETVIIRQEAVSMRRWEKQLRGIKDYISDDSMSYFPASSWGPTQSTLFDAVVPAIQLPGAPVGTAFTIPQSGANGYSVVGGVIQKTVPAAHLAARTHTPRQVFTPCRSPIRQALGRMGRSRSLPVS